MGITDTIPKGGSNSTDEVERRKDELDLRPALEFIERHIGVYERAWRRLMHQTPVDHKAAKPKVVNVDHISPVGPQIMPLDVLHILSRMPPVLLELSMLETFDYKYASTIPVPVFENDGSWEKVDFVPAIDFPRKDDHESRILLGYSTGKEIFPSVLPPCVHENFRVRWFYQLHAFLHEFFHTIELLRRNVEIRQEILLLHDQRTYTIQKWWRDWETEFMPNHPPTFPSRYAGSYRRDLTLANWQHDRARTDRAIAEQMCESFVGYILGIIPNDEDNPNFKNHSNWLWQFMDKLATSTIVKK